MKILIVEDDAITMEFVRKGLQESGYNVECAADGEQGLSLARHGRFDAAIIDIMIPKIDGLTMIERLRAEGSNTPFLILSAKRTVDDRILGFKKGGDDYLTKPFSFSELLVRLQALLRRSSYAGNQNRLSIGDLTIDIFTRKVKRAGKEIELQPREFSLLEYFMRNPGITLSKTLLLENIWGYRFDTHTNVVDVLVHRLRNKIDRGFGRELIRTVRGMGYMIKDDKD
ncbi:MAG: response regulator transcription factor [Spirochaetales bacterium]|nr:response regulator transcription factor [Spirochaetales bacterium]